MQLVVSDVVADGVAADVTPEEVPDRLAREVEAVDGANAMSTPLLADALDAELLLR